MKGQHQQDRWCDLLYTVRVNPSKFPAQFYNMHENMYTVSFCDDDFLIVDLLLKNILPFICLSSITATRACAENVVG